MRHILKYRDFGTARISESNSAQSDKEIIEKMPEDQKMEIEAIIAKHFNQKVNLDSAAETEEKESEEGGKTNEGAVLLAITIASLIPVAMEAVGTLGNLLKQKFGINLDEKQMAGLRKIGDAIECLKKISAGKEAEFLGKKHGAEDWTEIGQELVKHLGAGGESAENIKEEIGRLTKLRDGMFGSSFSKWLKEKGHQLHHLYTSPIRAALLGISKLSGKDSKLREEHFREKAANIIYAITMIGLAGAGIWEGLSQMAGVKDVGSIILKGIESGVNSSEIRKQALKALISA